MHFFFFPCRCSAVTLCGRCYLPSVRPKCSARSLIFAVQPMLCLKTLIKNLFNLAAIPFIFFLTARYDPGASAAAEEQR